MELYRSGHNEPHSKCGSPPGLVGSNPTNSANTEPVLTAGFCFIYWNFNGLSLFDSDVYWAAVKTSYFREFVARQEKDCWCWAACVQMVLNYQGINVDQEDVVRRAKGLRINEGGTAYDIQRAADGWNTGSHVIAARVNHPCYVTAQTFITDLIDKYPL